MPMQRSASAHALDARTRDIRLAQHMTKTPMGGTFQHVGTSTPMVDYKQAMAVQGYVGPWRSIGAYYESCAAALTKEHLIRGDQRVSRYWPFGHEVVKVNVYYCWLDYLVPRGFKS